ncbi:MAG: metal-dependent transcriptional regulator [Bacteroidetes bacterium]|jgi:DtxR family transcriptional regulator, Mn-dependent transcriptional regulator|nr:metal-dependent transcriptional regulator [Bacteroidota bacterium]PHX83274.1 MAG: iron-dependent repressor [Flavobacteriales bacterium]
MQTLSEENYLKAIWKLVENSGVAVSTNEIAASVQTSPASVTDMLKKLADKKLISYQRYRGVTLSAKGRSVAIEVVRKHRLWEVFLVQQLGFKWDEVHDIAEQLEHIRSNELTEKLDKYLGFPKTDPHGDPIPDKTGKISELHQIPLSKLEKGKKGIMTGVADHSTQFLQLLDKHGIHLGDSIEIKETTAYDLSIAIAVNKKKTIHISNSVSKNIMVSKNKS